MNSIKGYSSNYLGLCDLEIIFSNNKEWITLRDGAGSSVTVKIKTLFDTIGIEKTNGDMIKALFPCLEKYEYEELYTHGIALAGNDNRVTWFANEWWNAPYKRGDTDE